MAWPKGKKRKAVQNGTSESVGSNSTATLETAAPLQQGRFDLVLGVRRIRSGNFSGLWELCELSSDPHYGIRRVMTDANVKQILLAQIGRRFNECF